MRLGTRGRYAVAAMADIALHGKEAPVTLASVAGRQDLSASYLEQLFADLRRRGLVASARGPGGGYRLARPASRICISEIFAAVGEDVRAMRCGEGEAGEGCTRTPSLCLAHNLWERLSALVHVFLQTTSLADLVEDRLVPCPAVPDFLEDAGSMPLERRA